MKKEMTAFIFARGGSKGVKNKNIRLVGGHPLIAHAIRCALGSQFIQQVIVSTDDDQIADVSQKYGAKVLRRPPSLASDDSPEILSWKHAIENSPEIFQDSEKSLFISLPATSPLRSSSDVDSAIQRFLKLDCDIVFGISPSHRNPYLNMVTIDQRDLLKIAIPGSAAFRRQDVPDVFDITTCVYVSRPSYLRSCQRLTEGKVGYIQIPVERSIDIDTEYDLYLADLILTHPFQPAAKEQP